MSTFDPNAGGTSSSSAPGTGDNVARQNAAQSDNSDYSVIVERGQPSPGSTPGQSYRFRGSASEGQTTGYASADQTRTASELLNEWRHADSQRIAALQSQLVAANLLGPKDYTPGIWDEKTEGAYLLTLRRANLQDKTPNEILTEAGKAAAAAGTQAGAENPALTINVANPEDIKKAAKDQAKNILGRKLSDKEAETFVALYQGLEASQQRQQYAQTYGAPGHAGPGGTTVNPPSLAAFTEDQIRSRYPIEAGAHDIADQGSSFFNMLRGA